MSIVNNSKLETMGGGALLAQAYGTVRIEDNPRLDPNCTHTLQEYTTRRRIRGNRLNCGCELDSPLKSTNVDSIANDCDPLFGRLVLDGTDIPSADVLSEKFGKARNLTGELIVINTNLTNLAFLSNLRNITSVYNASAEFVEKFVRIENNTGLQRLGWDNFEGVTGSTVRIARNQNLCFTVVDLSGLLGTEYVNKIEGAICKGLAHLQSFIPEIQAMKSIQRVCQIAHDTDLASLPADCWIIVGGLILDNNTRPTDLWKLYNVTYIYGGLTVSNSTLTGFSPMWKVERIFNPSCEIFCKTI
ncbi:unnamed protein product [Heligmosomoides polygyrus]|uniref:Recep_L_domain domain-containing protein n=1 Tax=Heligmosomoides polygyrus TaxID=6339 RepID=A0A183FU06_HELPZ|nr:unnamed protein product [Heligmosomoides polygyrus]